MCVASCWHPGVQCPSCARADSKRPEERSGNGSRFSLNSTKPKGGPVSPEAAFHVEA